MSEEEIRQWLNERGVNNYGGSISVEDVVKTLIDFQTKITDDLEFGE
jgi:hypothetical protein